MDRQKEMEFVQMLTRHFNGIDTDVKQGKSAHTTTPTKVKLDVSSAAPRQRLVSGDKSGDSDTDRASAIKRSAFKRSAQRAVADSRFISYHPITRRPIHHNVERPPLPEDPRHISYLGNTHRQRAKTLISAVRAAEELSLIAKSKRVLKQMAKLLPVEHQKAELASIASSQHPDRYVNFECALDNFDFDETSAATLNDVPTPAPSWLGHGRQVVMSKFKGP